MSELIAIGYPNQSAASEVLDRLADLQKQMLIELEDAVILERRGDGKVKLHQTRGVTAGGGAAGGAVWGGLIGLLFFAPLLGMALGAGAGALVGASTDSGVDDDFLTGLGATLPPGHAALVLLVRSITLDRVLQQLHGQYGGELLRTSLSAADEAQLKSLVSAARS